MRLYVTPSGRWSGTQADACRAARECDAGRWEQIDVPTDKSGLLAFLNERAPGRTELRPRAIEPATQSPDQPCHSLALDDAWDSLPLARQLHFASLAMERARQEIKR